MKLVTAVLLSLFALPSFGQSPADVIGRDSHFIAFRSQLELERFLPDKPILFVGDSLIQNLELNSLHPKATNFGIGGDTSAGVLHRLKQYQSLKNASVVVLESGVNDLGFGPKFDGGIVDNYRKMLALIPSKASVYILGMFPVDETASAELIGYNKRINVINRKLETLCRSTQRCKFVGLTRHLSDKNGNLRAELHNPKDGVHYNDAGRQVILRELSRVITNRAPA